MPDCCRICAFVRFAVSAAKSASTILDREADKFSDVVCRLATTDSKRDWYEPRSERMLLIVLNALSTAVIVSFAPDTVATEATEIATPDPLQSGPYQPC